MFLMLQPIKRAEPRLRKELREANANSMRSVKAKMYHAYYSFLSQIIAGEWPRDVSVTGGLLLAGSEVSK